MLPLKKLGNTGLEVTRLGYGSMGLRGPRTWGIRVVDDESAERVLNTVLDSGINFIDTAPDYGNCEERIGRFISHRRQEFILATKCGCDPIQHPDSLEIAHTWTPETVQRNLETSLKHLQTDFIDILQFHGGDAETLQRTGLIDQLLKFKAQKLIRCLGISSSLPELADLIELNVFDTFQIPYSCLAPQHHTQIVKAAAAGAGMIIRGGIAQGGPDAVIQRESLNNVWNRARLEEILPADMTKAELILRFTLSEPSCHTVIVGTADLAHLAANVTAAERGPLPKELRNEIQTRVQQAIDSVS